MYVDATQRRKFKQSRFEDLTIGRRHNGIGPQGCDGLDRLGRVHPVRSQDRNPGTLCFFACHTGREVQLATARAVRLRDRRHNVHTRVRNQRPKTPAGQLGRSHEHYSRHNASLRMPALAHRLFSVPANGDRTCRHHNPHAANNRDTYKDTLSFLPDSS